MKTKLVFSLLLLTAAGGGGWWWYSRAATEKAVNYETAPVTRGNIVVTVNATGTLNPITTVLVGSQVSGRIEKLFADYNSQVKAGQVVAQLEQSTFTSKVRQNEAGLARAKANVALAKANLERQRQLMASRLISQAELDDAQAKYDQAVADQMQAQATLDAARVDLEHTTIFSPVDGIVLARSVDVGQTVAATLQSPTLFTIAADLTKMQINASVDEADIGQVQVGQTVNFTVDAYPDLAFQGKVTQVRNSPIIVQNVVTYDTIISVDNSELKLKPGMTANVMIEVASRENALRVPNAALRFKLPEAGGAGGAEKRTPGSFAGAKGGGGGGEGWKKGGPRKRTGQQVYILVNDKPKAVAVKTGLTDGAYTEILDGLQENDKVIVAVVTPRNSGTQTTVNPFSGPRLPGPGRGGFR
ncbi:MAG: efflux RND transporter periplasmic adaptor subunit [Verrucomicrobiae bacterium]|nr:efflux RND transporter periplasmic adaptor subunit [Verrucomicrobiae bacterium]